MDTAKEYIYPEELARQEAALIESRRRDLGLAEKTAQVGIAVSGGGIRSATFALGLFQAMARHGLLKEIDYLSTVSGGGYFGGFFGKLFLAAGVTPEQASRQASAALADSQSPPVAWLRENGRYIAPKGSGDYFFAGGIYLRNWAAVQYVVGITLLTIFLMVNTARGALWQAGWWRQVECASANFSLPHIWASPWLLLPAVLFAAVLVPLAAAYWLTQSYQPSGRATLMGNGGSALNYPLVGLGVLVLAAAGGFFLPPRIAALVWIPHQGAPRCAYVYVMIVGLLSIALYSWAAQGARVGTAVATARNRLSRWLGTALLFLLMMLIFVVVDSLGQSVYAVWLAAHEHGRLTVLSGLVTAALIYAARHFAPLISADQTKTRKLFRVPANVLALAAGAFVALVVATFWSTLGHAILWRGEVPPGDPGAAIASHYAPPEPNAPVQAEPHPASESPGGGAIAAPGAQGPDTLLASAACLLGLIISLLTGKTMTFLNLSTIQQFYAARLSRAYLGASNPRRTGNGNGAPEGNADDCARTRDVTEVVGGDDLAFDKYRPERHGGPIHLINVTINETVAGTSQLEQRDRKGMGMALGPCGISVSRIDHALWQIDTTGDGTTPIESIATPVSHFAIFETAPGKPIKVEALTLGQWIGVSGAAFTTGLGARTNLGLSLLLGLANVRLGYWWNSGMSPRERAKNRQGFQHASKPTDWLEPLFSAQVYLADEFLARFYGPHRQRWYLSDGGHFENTALYELLRRRLPFMIASDNGCDDQYVFADLANLIRKARIDFNAEIRFLDKDALDTLLDPAVRKLFGTPADLQRRVASGPEVAGDNRLDGVAYSQCHALLAWVYYDGAAQPGSVILFIKPSLTGDEPLDLLQYQAQHPAFPQETTLDQFFDEAQWESYRKLGSYIGDQLFGAIPTRLMWTPQSMRQPR